METKAFVDRFEEDLAVIYLDVDPSIKQKIIVPREILPEDINDGDHITIKIEKDVEETFDAEDEAISILQRLKNRKKSVETKTEEEGN